MLSRPGGPSSHLTGPSIVAFFPFSAFPPHTAPPPPSLSLIALSLIPQRNADEQHVSTPQTAVVNHSDHDYDRFKVGLGVELSLLAFVGILAAW